MSQALPPEDSGMIQLSQVLNFNSTRLSNDKVNLHSKGSDSLLLSENPVKEFVKTLDLTQISNYVPAVPKVSSKFGGSLTARSGSVQYLKTIKRNPSDHMLTPRTEVARSFLDIPEVTSQIHNENSKRKLDQLN